MVRLNSALSIGIAPGEVDRSHCQIIIFGAAHPCAACLQQAGTESLIQSEIP